MAELRLAPSGPRTVFSESEESAPEEESKLKPNSTFMSSDDSEDDIPPARAQRSSQNIFSSSDSEAESGPQEPPRPAPVATRPSTNSVRFSDEERHVYEAPNFFSSDEDTAREGATSSDSEHDPVPVNTVHNQEVSLKRQDEKLQSEPVAERIKNKSLQDEVEQKWVQEILPMRLEDARCLYFREMHSEVEGVKEALIEDLEKCDARNKEALKASELLIQQLTSEVERSASEAKGLREQVQYLSERSAGPIFRGSSEGPKKERSRESVRFSDSNVEVIRFDEGSADVPSDGSQDSIPGVPIPDGSSRARAGAAGEVAREIQKKSEVEEFKMARDEALLKYEAQKQELEALRTEADVLKIQIDVQDKWLSKRIECEHEHQRCEQELQECTDKLGEQESQTRFYEEHCSRLAEQERKCQTDQLVVKDQWEGRYRQQEERYTESSLMNKRLESERDQLRADLTEQRSVLDGKIGECRKSEKVQEEWQNTLLEYKQECSRIANRREQDIELISNECSRLQAALEEQTASHQAHPRQENSEKFELQELSSHGVFENPEDLPFIGQHSQRSVTSSEQPGVKDHLADERKVLRQEGEQEAELREMAEVEIAKALQQRQLCEEQHQRLMVEVSDELYRRDEAAAEVVQQHRNHLLEERAALKRMALAETDEMQRRLQVQNHCEALEDQYAELQQEKLLLQQEHAEFKTRADSEVVQARGLVTILRTELAVQEAEAQKIPPHLQAEMEERLSQSEAQCEAARTEVGLLRDRLCEEEQQRELQQQQQQRPPHDECAPLEPFSEEQLATALKKTQASSKWLSSMPTAYVELYAELHPEATTGGDEIHEAARQVVRAAVAEALICSGVDPADVEAEIAWADRLHCVVRIRSCRSVRAVAEALSNAVHGENEAGRSLRSILEQVGTEFPEVRVEPRWPIERLQAEVDFEYGYKLSDLQMEKLTAAVSECHKVYEKAWEQTGSRETPKALEPLIFRGCAHRLDGQLQPEEDEGLNGRRRSIMEDINKQGATSLRGLLEDAAVAQLQLKASLAPGTAWARTDLRDVHQVPEGHVFRTWQSSPRDPLPCGEHYDPGVEDEGQLLQRIKSRRQILEADPIYTQMLGVSRLLVAFDSADCLQRSLDWLLANHDVLWVDNRFRNPSCLGCRDVSIGVQQRVPAAGGRSHISELRLTLRELYEADKGKPYEGLRSTLEQCGVRHEDIDGVCKLVLRVLDCTDCKLVSDIARALWRCTLSLKEHRASATDAQLYEHLVTKLQQEVDVQCRTAGINEQVIAQIKAKAIAASRQNPPQQADAAEVRCHQLEQLLMSCNADKSKLMEEISRLSDGMPQPGQDTAQVQHNGMTTEPVAGHVGAPRACTAGGELTAAAVNGHAVDTAPHLLAPSGRGVLRSNSPRERQRLATRAQSTAASVHSLLRQVRSLQDARAVLASGGHEDGASMAGNQLRAVHALEQQIDQLEHTNHQWASSMAGRSPLSLPGWTRGAANDDMSMISSGRGLSDSAAPWGSSMDCTATDLPSPLAPPGPGINSALEQTARRLESLHGRLGPFLLEPAPIRTA